MQRDIRDINKEYDVEGLCHEFPQRLQDLSVKTCGDRLKNDASTSSACLGIRYPAQVMPCL